MKKIILAFAILATPFFTHAEWAKEIDADIELNDEVTNIEVSADGSYVLTEQRTFTALNDKGRSRLAHETIKFIPDSMSVSIKSAASITKGITSKVDLKSIQERTAEGPSNGVNALKELVIPFNNLKVGSSIKYEYALRVKKAAVAGIFSMRLIYGLSFPERSGKVIVTSPKKIHFASIDPDKALNIQSSQEGKLYKLSVTLMKSAFKIPNEASASIPKNLHAQVEFSTADSWNEFAKEVSAKYEKILAIKTLPPALKEIAVNAAALKNPFDKINKVTSELANVMTYSGDWTSLEKMFYPKDLAEIAKLKMGDCKDFAVATTAILRSLGFQADVSLVYRQDQVRVVSQIMAKPIDLKIALSDIFNHAIVHVTVDNKDIWVDPTNIVSNAKLIYSDIAASPALVLNKETLGLSMIPESTTQESIVSINKILKINPDETVDSEGSFEAKGDYAKSLFEVAIYKNEQTAKERILSLYGTDPRHKQFFLDGLNFKTRIADKIEVKVKVMSEKNVFKEEKENKSLFIPMSSRLGVFGVVGQNRVTDFYVGPRATEKTITKIPGYDFGSKDYGCFTLTPWYTIERKLLKTKEGFDVQDVVNYRQSLIKASDINQENFQFNIGDIADCARAQNITIHPLKQGEDLKMRMKNYNTTRIDELLNASGPASIETTREAKNIVDGLLFLDPKDKMARRKKYSVLVNINFKRNDIDRTEYNKAAGEVINQLYLEFSEDDKVLKLKTYYAIRTENMGDAKKFFKQAYYTSKKNFEIYALGGFLAEKLHDLKTAEGSYKKALELTKDFGEISGTYLSLAGIAWSQKQNDVAINYYKKAIQYNPSDAWLYSGYVNKLNYLQKWDEAIAAGEKMLKLADFGVGRNLLGKAYSGKAVDIWQTYTRTKRFVTDPDQDVVANICMKALKYKDTDFNCLSLLGFFALNTARMENDLAKAQKAYDYYTRALQDPENMSNPENLKLQAEAKQIVARLQASKDAIGNNVSSRLPASSEK